MTMDLKAKNEEKKCFSKILVWEVNQNGTKVHGRLILINRQINKLDNSQESI